MVDFKKHLKDPQRSSPLFSGELTAWINKSEAPEEEASPRTCKWEIRPYDSMHGEWITFYITKGGVTGYESFVLRDEKEILVQTIEWIFTEKYWSACAGGSGWNAMRVPTAPIRSAVNKWLETQDEILSLCMTCKKVYDHKSAEGANGGISHGFCDGCSTASIPSIKKSRRSCSSRR